MRPVSEQDPALQNDTILHGNTQVLSYDDNNETDFDCPPLIPSIKSVKIDEKKRTSNT
jgi:hypothetical protein